MTHQTFTIMLILCGALSFVIGWLLRSLQRAKVREQVLLVEREAEFEAGFYSGYFAARHALVKFGWTSDSVNSVGDAVQVLDDEKAEIMRMHERSGSLR